MYAHAHTWAHAYETDTAATLDDKPNQIYLPETQIYSIEQQFIWVCEAFSQHKRSVGYFPPASGTLLLASKLI